MTIYPANFVDWNLIAIASLKPENQVLILSKLPEVIVIF